MSMACNICGAEARHIFNKQVLGKYDVRYFQCTACHFIQTEAPYWLKNAYNSPIAQADIGILERNIQLSGFTARMLARFFDVKGIFLDYAGGYGIFTRLMRDKGFDFYHSDPYCRNIYAQFFSLDDLGGTKRKFDLVTAFELVEHLEKPCEDLEKILAMTDSFFFTTQLLPENYDESWWYFLPLTGQHISFYTRESLAILAKSVQANLYTDGQSKHLITRRQFSANPLIEQRDFGWEHSLAYRVYRKIRRIFKEDPPPLMVSKLWPDFEETMRRLSTQKERDDA